MSFAVSSVTSAPALEGDTANTTPPTRPSHSKQISDTIQISSAAQAAATAALEELTETHAQTAREAQHGDRQAQRLLAKEAIKLHP